MTNKWTSFQLASLVVAIAGFHNVALADSQRNPSMTQDYAPTNPSEKAPSDTTISIGKSEDFTLNFNGFAQGRYTLDVPTDKNMTQTFDLALARVAFSGNAFGKDVSYFFQLNASTLGNTNQVSLIDAWLQYHLAPEISIKAGRTILAYSRQFYTHPGNLLLTDLSIADYAFNLSRSTGAEVSGKVFERVSYSVAATNSIRALDASGQENPNNALASVARFEFDILKPYGYLESSPTFVGDAQLSLGIAGAINPVADSSAMQNLTTGSSTYNLTVDGGYRYGLLSVQSAGYYRYDRSQVPATKSHDWGTYAQAGFYVVPERWEVAAQYSHVHFGQQINAQSNGQANEYVLGLNRYIHGHNLKLQSDFRYIDQTTFQGQKVLDKQFHLQAQILF